MLTRWQGVTKFEYPEFVHLIPHPGQIDLNKLAAWLLIHATLRRRWIVCLMIMSMVKHAQCFVTTTRVKFGWRMYLIRWLTFWEGTSMIVLMKLLLSCVCLQVSLHLLVHSKTMFSLCANYPKGLGEVFWQWMKENHSGKLFWEGVFSWVAGYCIDGRHDNCLE